MVSKDLLILQNERWVVLHSVAGYIVVIGFLYLGFTINTSAPYCVRFFYDGWFVFSTRNYFSTFLGSCFFFYIKPCFLSTLPQHLTFTWSLRAVLFSIFRFISCPNLIDFWTILIIFFMLSFTWNCQWCITHIAQIDTNAFFSPPHLYLHNQFNMQMCGEFCNFYLIWQQRPLLSTSERCPFWHAIISFIFIT